MLFFDDQYPINRKVSGLSDTAYRLHDSAIFWCGRNLTDGVIPEEDLEDVCARVRKPRRFVTEIIGRGLWHEIGSGCESKKCPEHHSRDSAASNGVTRGWVVHDYFEWQKTKAQIQRERELNAERQRRFRQRRNGVTDEVLTSGNDETNQRNAVSHACVTQPSPSPSRRDGTSLSDTGTGDQSVRAGARVKEARRYLRDRYGGLTDDEADWVISEVERRAREPIKHLTAYLKSMAEGDLADLTAAAMDRTRAQQLPPPEPPRPAPSTGPPPGHDQPPAASTGVPAYPDTSATAAEAVRKLRTNKGWQRPGTATT